LMIGRDAAIMGEGEHGTSETWATADVPRRAVSIGGSSPEFVFGRLRKKLISIASDVLRT